MRLPAPFALIIKTIRDWSPKATFKWLTVLSIFYSQRWTRPIQRLDGADGMSLILRANRFREAPLALWRSSHELALPERWGHPLARRCKPSEYKLQSSEL